MSRYSGWLQLDGVFSETSMTMANFLKM